MKQSLSNLQDCYLTPTFLLNVKNVLLKKLK